MFRAKTFRIVCQVVVASAVVGICSERDGQSKNNTTLLALSIINGTWCDKEIRHWAHVRGPNNPKVESHIHENEILTLPDGSKYLGDLEDGQRSKHGESWDTKGHYVGNWANNLKKGQGKLRYHNGFTYEGEFSEDLPHGRGTVTLTTGEKLDGEFVRGKLQDQELPEFGWSKVITRRGLVAEGDFTFPSGDPDIFSGYGRITAPGYFVYKGGVARGLFAGEGVLTWTALDSTLVEEGVFVQGRMGIPRKTTFYTRHGVIEYLPNPSDGAVQHMRYTLRSGTVYEGKQVHGKFHGPMTISEHDGTVWKGMYFHDKMYGKWTIYEADGRVVNVYIPLSYANRFWKWWEERK